MNKPIYRFLLSNGETWEVPAHVIADDRGKYYAKKDKDTTYQEEYDFAILDDYEIIDWARNNMNWSDVKTHARLAVTARPDFDYAEAWVNPEETEIIR